MNPIMQAKKRYIMQQHSETFSMKTIVANMRIKSQRFTSKNAIVTFWVKDPEDPCPCLFTW